MEGRRRLSRGSVEEHTSQLQPMVGTPELVPDPSTVILMAGELIRPLTIFLRLPVSGSFRSSARIGIAARSASFRSASVHPGLGYLWSSRRSSPSYRWYGGQLAGSAPHPFPRPVSAGPVASLPAS